MFACNEPQQTLWVVGVSLRSNLSTLTGIKDHTGVSLLLLVEPQKSKINKQNYAKKRPQNYDSLSYDYSWSLLLPKLVFFTNILYSFLICVLSILNLSFCLPISTLCLVYCNWQHLKEINNPKPMGQFCLL